jgi:nucleoside phosphorylase
LVARLQVEILRQPLLEYPPPDRAQGKHTMTVVDRKWAERNTGIDPIAQPPHPATFATMAAAAKDAEPEDFQREIIDFDSEGTEGREFTALTTSTGLSAFTDIPWPKGLAPQTGPKPKGGNAPLPRADVLVVTWTVDEGHALSRVLTPGKDSRNDYVPYTHNYAAIAKKMRAGAPALQAKRLGAYWTTTIGKKKCVIFKSDSHMSQDGPKLPNREIWRQIIEEVRPKLVITTGTGGGIGRQFEVGDVIVSPVVRFDCLSKFKNSKFAQAHYSSEPADQKFFKKALSLFKANVKRLPPENKRFPKIVPVAPGALKASVVTTDFFGFDTSNDHYKLQGLGDLSEMGDAVLGLVAQDMKADGENPPPWVAIRNVSDPQIKAEGTLREQAAVAAHIYKAFGRWSSVCSAITCWATIVALK